LASLSDEEGTVTAKSADDWMIPVLAYRIIFFLRIGASQSLHRERIRFLSFRYALRSHTPASLL
jgi:hypothetical protein